MKLKDHICTKCGMAIELPEFDEPQLKMMKHFADFLVEIDERGIERRQW